MALESSSPAVFEFIASVARAYAALTQCALADPQIGLGGKFFYAGQLDNAGRTLVVAANIAGAATLVTTADPTAQKQALRDGITDFVVTSLDEALRIMKNELRKRQAVSVCVGLGPADVECEMRNRGVLPDLQRRDLRIAQYEALKLQERDKANLDLRKVPAVVTWHIDSALPKGLAKLDEIALACLGEEEWAARRWLRLAPRFLGRLAKGLHLVESHREFAARFAEQVTERVNRHEISFAYEIRTYVRGLEGKEQFNSGKP